MVPVYIGAMDNGEKRIIVRVIMGWMKQIFEFTWDISTSMASICLNDVSQWTFLRWLKSSTPFSNWKPASRCWGSAMTTMPELNDDTYYSKNKLLTLEYLGDRLCCWCCCWHKLMYIDMLYICTNYINVNSDGSLLHYWLLNGAWCLGIRSQCGLHIINEIPWWSWYCIYIIYVHAFLWYSHTWSEEV